MNKILLTNDDIEFVLRWRDDNKQLVRLGMSPLKEVKLVCTESGYTITAIRRGDLLEFGIVRNGKSFGKLMFRTMKNGMCGLVKDNKNLSQDDKQSVLTVYSSLMALLVFGEATVSSGNEDVPDDENTESSDEVKIQLVAQKYHKKSKKSQSSGITYILTKKENESTTQPKVNHRSPSCSFTVRGHFRHYKNGKVVWISEYRKGTGKNRDKTYKIGADTK